MGTLGAAAGVMFIKKMKCLVKAPREAGSKLL